MFETFQPVTPEAALKAHAASPAQMTPATVPAVATNVFRAAPPMKYMVTRVVTAHSETVTA